jgi:hypothetical protein
MLSTHCSTLFEPFFWPYALNVQTSNKGDKLVAELEATHPVRGTFYPRGLGKNIMMHGLAQRKIRLLVVTTARKRTLPVGDALVRFCDLVERVGLGHYFDFARCGAVLQLYR